MTLTQEPQRRFVDPQQATVDRRIFFDADVYQLEMERIFARAWLFRTLQADAD